MIKIFVMLAAGILENTAGEQREIVNFPLAGISFLLKGCLVLGQVIWQTSLKQDNRQKMHNPSSNCALLDSKLCQIHVSQ